MILRATNNKDVIRHDQVDTWLGRLETFCRRVKGIGLLRIFNKTLSGVLGFNIGYSGHKFTPTSHMGLMENHRSNRFVYSSPPNVMQQSSI